MKNLLVISNDEVNFSKNQISTKYNDTINILDTLNKKFNVFLISRVSKSKDNFTVKKKNISRLDFKKFLILRKKKLNTLMISITPRNIFFYLLLNLFFNNLKNFVYLRSDGYKEYKTKFGELGRCCFALMMKILGKKIKIISVSKNITSPKIDYLITPSELNKFWFKKKKNLKINFPRLLYFGRFKKEKGIFSLINLLNNQKFKYQLTIAGDKNYPSLNNKNIKFINEFSKQKEIINLYDNHNIFILPSYTEGAPKVILESLARKKPVIVFKDIKHVKNNFKGIFVCERNIINLKNLFRHILSNYSKIQKNMNKNILITKNEFQKKLLDILYA